MSGLAIRIGNNFKQIQKRVHGDGFISSFKSFQGVRIAEMSLCSTALAKKEKQDTCNIGKNKEKQEDEEKNKDVKATGQDIFIIEELVNKTAKVRIRSELPDSRWWFQKSKDQPDFKLDWSEVEVIPAIPNFQPIDGKEEVQESIRVISSTLLKNESKVSQWHKIKTERQILSACESSLTKGCVIGGKIGITLSAPDALGFSAGFSLRRAQQNFDAENIAWVGTDCIKIRKGDTITVTIQSKKQRKEFKFTALIGVKGAVYALFDNPGTHTTARLPISIREIFREEIPTLITKEENDTIYFKITGRCKFENDVDHEIIIQHVNST